MKKCILSTFLLLVMFVMTGVSCKSAPPPDSESESKTTEAVTDDGQEQALKKSIARAEEARKKAQDFESPSYFPSDWEAVEAQYTAAVDMDKSTEDGVKQATDEFNSAADSYHELFGKTISLYAQAREDEIMAARDELIKTGFGYSFPEYLSKADKIALTALDQYEKEDYYKSRDTAAEALNEYETLLVGAKLYLTRSELVDRGFDAYDHENFDKADEVADSAVAAYEAGNREAAISAAEEAMIRYGVVRTNGWISYSADRRALASSEREKALSNKVNIAVRDTFRDAETLYNSAQDNFTAKKYEEAASLFTDAEALYVVAGRETEEKRRKAIETIKMAEEKVEESSESATEADRIIEGGSK